MLAGLFLSLYSTALPHYLGEILSPSLRDSGLPFILLIFNVGVSAAFIIIPYLTVSMMAAVLAIISIVSLIGIWFMPYSPHYLVAKNRIEEAKNMLEKLRGGMDFTKEIENITETIIPNNNRRNFGGIKELLFVRENRRCFTIICLFMIIPSLGGYIIILTYLEMILDPTKNMISSSMITFWVSAIQIFSTIMGICLYGKVKRKPLILITGLIATVSHLACVVFFYMKEYIGVDVTAYSSILFIAVMTLIFTVNFGPIGISAVILSEIFAPEIKALATCLVYIISASINATAYMAYMLVVENYGHTVPFIIFLVVTVVCTVILFLITPEMKGKDLTQIQKERLTA